MRTITLIGCGNIGSRHLQAITKLKEKVEVDIIEPNRNAQVLAKKLCKISHNNHSFHWHNDIKKLEHQSDLAIIATTAVGRVDLINKLLDLGNSRFLVEKMVCQSTIEYRLLLKQLKSFNAKGWVNLPRRYFASYQRIKKFFDNKQIHMSVVTGNVGLGSNAIHFVDLFSWFSRDYKVRLNGDFLVNKVFENKRGKDFLEFAGTIIGSVGNSSLVISFLPFYGMPQTIDIASKDIHILVEETSEKVFVYKGKADIEFKMDFVSNLTTKIVHDIFENDKCFLPTLEESYFYHGQLFRIFNNHIKKTLNEERKMCPIT